MPEHIFCDVAFKLFDALLHPELIDADPNKTGAGQHAADGADQFVRHFIKPF